MILLTETVLFYWDCLDYLCRQSTVTQVDKDNWAGIGEITDWADTLASSKSLHTRSIPASARTSSRASCLTSASSTRPSTPHESEGCNSYIRGNDEAEHNAMSNPTSKAVKRTDAMASLFLMGCYLYLIFL